MIRFTVTDELQTVVPIRFERAIHGFSRRDAPEVDDCGWIQGSPAAGWAHPVLRGPMVGLMAGSTVRVKVVREDIDATAPLFVTVEDPSKIEIVLPAANAAIPADGIIEIMGLTAHGAPGKVQVRLGSITGPILGELEPHIFARLRIPITVHRVRIDQGATHGTVPNQPIERMVRRMRAIWWPCGIDIVFDPHRRPIVDDHIALARRNEVNDPANDAWAEVKQILGLQRARLRLPAGTKDRSINWYIIDKFSPDASGFTTVGLGIRPELAHRLHADPGILTTADGVTTEREIERAARTVAHEIGHFFTLKHVQERNSGNPVTDTYGRRQLMFPISFLPAAVSPRTLLSAPRTDDVGYGHEVRGCLVTMKNHRHHSTDGEAATAQRVIRSGRWY